MRSRCASACHRAAATMLIVYVVVLGCFPGKLLALRKNVIYSNEFAVHVPSGKADADKIAAKHGFVNIGQIGSLKGYYLLSHHHVHKRSLNISHDHHKKLEDETEVHWFQQQHERRRLKRDYQYISPQWIPSVSGASPEIAPPVHRTRYRALGAQNIFPDPLFKEQWYLNGGAKDGLDMNVGPAWQKGYTGKGVVVSILDDGIQTNHPDLSQNYDPSASTDINGNDDDPMPKDDGDNKHGTRCAGEVAAVAFNSYCGVGVAYNASIGGVRMLDGVVNDAVEARALSLNPEHIDIYSASWGPEDDGKTVDGPGPLARRAFIYGVTSGRKGKGSIFVWASGNGGRHTDSCNCDGYTNSIFTLSISSATQAGRKPWYLEECSSTLATTYSSGTPGHDKSVATVDMDGKLRPDRICTVEHTGTSASAPLAAGICALALEANPNLTWRDMQYLVVMSSNAAPLEKETGWITNGVKRKFSHKFGYGLMDAGAMVNLAEQWTPVPAQHICKSQEMNEERPIQPTFSYTVQVHMDVNGCSGTVNEVRFLEHVQCKISLRFFPRGNLRILLTSPMGTISTLLFERPRDAINSNFDDWPFLSVHFWGEKAEGRWTLQVINSGNRDVQRFGMLRKWQLIFYGTSTNPVRLLSQVNSGINGIHSGIPFAFPTASDGPLHSQSGTGNGQYYNTDLFSSNVQYPSIYTAAGSETNKVVTSLDGSHNIPTPQRENVMADANNKKVLHSCDPECDQQGCYGKGPTQCVACKHYRLDNTCVSRCPPRSFPNQGGVCWPCHESCETCAGAGQDSCLACAPAHLRVTDLAVCLQQCPDGYYENLEQNTCVPCSANCGSCQDRPDFCKSCDHHLVMHENKCYAACPQYTFETDDYNCAQCHSSCETCNGTSESQCISCRPGRYSLDGKCLSKCPDGHYADKKRRECLTCPVGCATCNSALCLTCDSGWILNKKGKCVPENSDHCDQAEYYSDGHCKLCHSTCETCQGGTESSCLTCAPPLLLQNGSCVATCGTGAYQEAGICAPCLHACTACVSRLNCTACAPGLRLQSGECRASCAPGYYSDRGLCSKCYLSCQTCSGPRRNQCVSCPTGWQLAAGECHPECPEGFFKSEFGCQKCHHYCLNCHGEGPLNCTSCPPHFMLDGGLCMECLGSQYYDPPTQLCRTCHDSCRSCSGPGAFSCVACTYPLRLDRLNNQCVPCCAGNAVPSSSDNASISAVKIVGGAPVPSPTDCCKCDKETGGCQNSSPAGKRRIAVSAERAEAYQQLGAGISPLDESWPGFHDRGVSEIRPSGDLSSLYTPMALTLTAFTIAVCLCVVLAFIVILLVLQKRSRPSNPGTRGVNYVPLASHEDKGSTLNLKTSKLAVSSFDVDADAEAEAFSDDGEDARLVTRT